MVREVGWIAASGNKIYAALWPVSQPKAVVALLHGLGEHCRRYDHVGAFFQANGIAMLACDHEGFGRSGGKRGFAKSFNTYYQEAGRLLVECEKQYPDIPVFFYGHSMGGNILLNYILRRHPVLAGAIVSAPHIGLAFEPSAIAVAAGKLMRGIWPSFTQKNQLNTHHLCRDKAVVSAYEADPLVHDALSAAVGIDMLEAANFLNTYAGKVSTPLLLMHGTEDQITSEAASRAFAERVEGATFKAWPGLFHELHNEPEKEEVLEYVLAWMLARRV